MPPVKRKRPIARPISSQTTIQPTVQTALTAAVQALGLRPSMTLIQTVESNRLILEPLQEAKSLAGSLSNGREPLPLVKLSQGTKIALAAASRKGL